MPIFTLGGQGLWHAAILIAFQCRIDTTGQNTLIHLITTKQTCMHKNIPVKAQTLVDKYEHAPIHTLPERWHVSQTESLGLT